MAKPKTPKIEELFEAGVHYGHQVRRWHPNFEPYIYTVRKNVHIINLEFTEKMLKEACDFLYEAASKGGQIVFLGTKRQARDIVKLEAQRCGAKYVTERWLGGTITNFRVIKKNIDKLVDMKKKRDAGEYEKYTKKEQLMIDREIEKLETSVGGIVGLNNVPAALFVVDARREKTAVREARRAKVPVVALVDTNTDTTSIDYPIPGNDDAIKSIAMIVKSAADAVTAGYKDYAEKKKEEDEEKAKEEERIEKERKAAEEKKLAEEKEEEEEKKKADDSSGKGDMDKNTQKETKEEKKVEDKKKTSGKKAKKKKTKSGKVKK